VAGMRANRRLAVVGAVTAVALSACAGVELVPTPEAAFLEAVEPDIKATDIWSEEKLLEGGGLVCSELDRTGGDMQAVYDMLLAGVSPGDSSGVVDMWISDTSAITAGAVTYLCPEWSEGGN
jgi:hypothetical protein